MVHEFADLIPVCFHLGDGGPVVMGGIQIVPGHFVHAYGKHGFEFGIDALVDNLGDDQFVYVKDGGMSQIENQGMSQGFCPDVKGFIPGERVV
jgi:hypothetical protein